MPENNSWVYQGRQYHQWFGHGTAPKEESRSGEGNKLFDLYNILLRFDYVTSHVIGSAPKKERAGWEAQLGSGSRSSLKTLVAAWYAARGKGRDTFRGQLLDPYTSDETVDQLRAAAKGIVEGRTHEQLGEAGEALASAAFKIGLVAWPRFLRDSEQQALDAVSAGAIPGVVKASATGTDTITGGFGVLLGLLYYYLTRSTPASKPPASQPMMTEQSPPAKQEEEKSPPVAPTTAKPGEAVLPDDRRKHILDGDAKGGGHGAGRGIPGKSEFPPDWSDDKAVQAIKDVANDPASVRVPAGQGRTAVSGTRDGIDIRVIIGADGKTIITGYPTNVTRNRR